MCIIDPVSCWYNDKPTHWLDHLEEFKAELIKRGYSSQSELVQQLIDKRKTNLLNEN